MGECNHDGRTWNGDCDECAEASGYARGVEHCVRLVDERAGATAFADKMAVLLEIVRQLRALLPQPSAPVGGGFVPRDPNAPPRYNGSGTPCDMDVGPCSCGATHVSAPPHPPAPQEAARMVEHHTRVMRR